MAATAFLFPGQGSQYAGMGSDLFDRYPEARETFERADARLDFALSDVMFGRKSSEIDADEALKQTHITQPALFVHSLAVIRVLETGDLSPAMCAGHSLGEYSALTAAGALDFEPALEIVQLRGRLMAEAGEQRPGAMAAVLGLEDEEVVRLCTDASDDSGSVVQAANFNAPGQVVISGDVKAVEHAMSLANRRGAKRTIPLSVSGAFHSPLMEHARDGLAEALRAIEIRPPDCPVYLNVTAEPASEPEEIRRRLLEQLTAPVLWSQSLRRMQADGADRFVEVGAGTVLTGLARRTLGRDVETATAGKADELASVMAANAS